MLICLSSLANWAIINKIRLDVFEYGCIILNRQSSLPIPSRPLPSSFVPPAPKSVPTRSLPPLFSRIRSRKPVSNPKIYTYDRDIICLPSSYVGSTVIPGTIAIPRSPRMREFLGKNLLIGKIRLNSLMSQDSIFQEIRSVFSHPMNKDSLFPFKILQPAGGNSKSLMVPSLPVLYGLPVLLWTANGAN